MIGDLPPLHPQYLSLNRHLAAVGESINASIFMYFLSISLKDSKQLVTKHMGNKTKLK